MSTSIATVSVKQLQKAIVIREKIEALQHQLSQIIGASEAERGGGSRKSRRKMSAAARRAIAAAQRARWAKVKEKTVKPATKGKRKMPAAAKAKLAAIARARWAKAKAAGKSAL